MKTVLVTGATGFLGRNLVARLKSEGYALRCTVRDRSRAEHLLEQDVELIDGDLSSRQVAFASVKDVDIVVHAAALLGGWGDEELFLKNNVVATRNLLEAAAQLGVRRFVYISSCAAYGLQPDVVLTEESSSKTEDEPYSATKLACEGLVRTFSENHGIVATVLRPSIIYGPCDRRFLPPIVEHIRRGTMAAIGKPHQGPPLVYVDDLTRFVATILSAQKNSFEVYNLSSPEHVSWEQIIKQVSTALGLLPDVRRVPFPVAYYLGAVLEFLWKLARATKQPMLTRFMASLIGLQYWFDSSKALSVPGFAGFTSFTEGLSRTLCWMNGEGEFEPILHPRRSSTLSKSLQRAREEEDCSNFWPVIIRR
jgi:nucleoside-diphosphate-sugar epimerase